MELPSPRLADGEGLLKIETLALTANVMAYASLAETLGYWDLFPASPGRGRVPAWGYGVVVASQGSELQAGARYFGLFPMSSFLVVGGSRNAQRFCRRAVSPAGAQPRLQSIFRGATQDAVERENNVLFRPLLIACFVLDSYLRESRLFGAERLLITSASSKTALGLAMRLGAAIPILGATSDGVVAFVESLGLYSQTLAYEGLADIDATEKTLVVDFAGDERLLARFEALLGPALTRTRCVGRTHGPAAGSPILSSSGVREFFFAPTHIERRVREAGAAAFEAQLAESLNAFATRSRSWFLRRYADGPAGLRNAYCELVRHETHSSDLIIARPNG